MKWGNAMSNSMKTIIFIISMFVFLFVFIVVNYVIPTGFVLEAFIYLAAYIAVLYSQALIKYLYTKNALKSQAVIKVFPVKATELRALLITLVLPIIAVLMPVVSRRSITAESLKSFMFLAVLAALIQLLFNINSRSMRVYVTDKGFAINGVDLRIELSIPFSYTNAAGWYPFERIENYLAYGNKVFLYQTYDMGVITFECSEEEVRQIKGLLVAKGVPERRY